MNLSPTEFTYLSDTLECNGAILLKTTLKDLFLKGVIDIESKVVKIDKRRNKGRTRYFFKKSDTFDQYISINSYEVFILELFDAKNEFQFYVLRHYVKNKLKEGGIADYQNKYIIPHLRKKGLIKLWYFPNAEAKNLCKPIQYALMSIKLKTEKGMFDTEFFQTLTLLGNHIIHLDSKILKKVSEESQKISRIDKISFLEILNKSFDQFDYFFGNYGFFEGGDDVGSFDGFGGGDFGGGGAFGDW